MPRLQSINRYLSQTALRRFPIPPLTIPKPWRLKALGSAALVQGGMQAVLQMLMGTLTAAEKVARMSKGEGNSYGSKPVVIP